MAEDSHRTKNNPLRPPPARPQPVAGDVSRTHTQPSMPPQPTKEMLYQQRQKCELRRLLKHTHPELKTLDGAVDEELAEVLSSEGGLAAAETGYEGEVLSRRWIFEKNCALGNKVDPPTPKTHMAEGTAERADVRRTSALFEQPWESLGEERVREAAEVAEGASNTSPDPNVECEEEMVRIDVQSTRRLFESQCVDAFIPSPDMFQGKVFVKKQNKSKNLDLTVQSHRLDPCAAIVDPSAEREFPENRQHWNRVSPQDFVEPVETGLIKTSAVLFQNNPFISTNIEREQSHSPCGDAADSRAIEDNLITNVKNRAHLFESMPFDQIKHQNKDDIETMVENINETLNALYRFNALHSHGAIIEVNETNLAKRARYVLSQNGPVIHYNEVAEGGAQNFIHQLLPREHLKPQVSYLKEDEMGNVQVTVADAPVHQHHFNANRDREFKTANVVQLIEDILDQDNSLRKGVIIQEDVNRCTEVTVYSLYKYAEGAVKSYHPPQGHRMEPDEPECAIGDDNKTDIQDVKGDVKSTISSLLAAKDQTCPLSITRHEVNIKGNVKLFRSCIEKGDLEYLKSLQAESSEQEPSPSQTQTEAGDNMESSDTQENQIESSDPEWVPVNVKKLKTMFSGVSADPNYVLPKQIFHGDVLHSARPSYALACQSGSPAKRESRTKRDKNILSHGQADSKDLREGGGQEQGKAHDFEITPQGPYPYLEPQPGDMVHQAELVEVVDDEDEISHLQAAIFSLQQATAEAKSFHHVIQGKQQHAGQALSDKHATSVTKSDIQTLKPSSALAGLPQDTVPCGDSVLKPPPSTTYVTPESQRRNLETSCEDMVPEEKQTSEACSAEGQQGTEVVQKGHLKAAIKSLQSTATEQHQEEKEDVVRGDVQAALNSLGRSSVNVTKGDFRAAMIYRNSSKSHRESRKKVDDVPIQKPTEKENDGPLTESKSTPSITFGQQGQVATEELSSTATAQPPSPGQTTNKPATGSSSEHQQTVSTVPTQKSKRPVGQRPAIPPKPDHLKVKDNQSTNTENLSETTQTISTEIETHSKDEQPLRPLLSKSMSYKEALCRGLSQTDSMESKPSSPDAEKHKHTKATEMAEEIQLNQQALGSMFTPSSGMSSNPTLVDESNVRQPQERNVTDDGKCSQNCSVEGNGNETDEKSIDFHGARLKFGGKQDVPVKNAPVKPKRVRIAQTEGKKQKHTSENNTSTTHTQVEVEPQQTTGPPNRKPNPQEHNLDKNNKHKDVRQESKVVMREKKVKMETEVERRQRLSVHMDEILRGNMSAAMEIFDNLRKQEELREILTKVEEIEEDTSDVDVSSLRTVFENVPTWVVAPKEKKQRQAKAEHTVKTSPILRDNSERMSSMAHVFGDLERASEEIMNLKEQTLARLMDIEGAIKKALYSVSTLKSDSDIAGLSGLFKESLGTAQASPTSGNIRKISIETSRTKTPQAQGRADAQRDRSLPDVDQAPKYPGAPAAKPQTSPQSSPAFISIESAVRKKDMSQPVTPDTATCPTCQHSPRTEEKFCTTKTLKCNSATKNKRRDSRKGGQKQSPCGPNSPLNPRHEVSVLEVKTVPEGNGGVKGTKTVTENYERTDNFGNRFHSTKTSTVVTTQSETTATSRGQVVTSPASHQVTTYPEVRLPVNKKTSTKKV